MLKIFPVEIGATARKLRSDFKHFWNAFAERTACLLSKWPSFSSGRPQSAYSESHDRSENSFLMPTRKDERCQENRSDQTTCLRIRHQLELRCVERICSVNTHPSRQEHHLWSSNFYERRIQPS